MDRASNLIQWNSHRGFGEIKFSREIYKIMLTSAGPRPPPPPLSASVSIWKPPPPSAAYVICEHSPIAQQISVKRAIILTIRGKRITNTDSHVISSD